MHAWKRVGCDGTGVLIVATTAMERDLAQRGVGLAPHPHPTPPLPQQPGMDITLFVAKVAAARCD